MSSFEYLLLMGACLLITLPLELLFSARVYRRWKVLIGSLVPIVLIFSLWDIVAISRDHWTYNPKYVTGVHLGDLPLEEIVFFIVIPICALLSYEAVGTVLNFFTKKAKNRRGGNDGA
ncbi:lycopene cyclase domain-containing protein [Brevibacterium sandarakinum]|uniref:Lycopene cyclase domain-containing protein n=1 Tax=Brevibacterium sandarakinum TaxID=629680 RepID=A0A1H1UUZ9_BRESA|nr:lycopene cyclase domain-containing protein [Brevibacterium sandarakinum]SDS76283.1 lycopene cyclase domain-containing protein [Brevibacterium sandarakinum]